MISAGLLIRQAVDGCQPRAVPIPQRAQNDPALAGGYVATTWTTELPERVDSRPG